MAFCVKEIQKHRKRKRDIFFCFDRSKKRCLLQGDGVLYAIYQTSNGRTQEVYHWLLYCAVLCIIGILKSSFLKQGMD